METKSPRELKDEITAFECFAEQHPEFEKIIQRNITDLKQELERVSKIYAASDHNASNTTSDDDSLRKHPS